MPLTRGRYPVTDPQWTLGGKPSGLYRQNMPRLACVTDAVAGLTTQVMASVALHCEAGDVISTLSFGSGATAAVTPTNWWFALYDDSATPALLAQSADQLTAAWAANTIKTLALATPQLISRAGIYYAAIMVKATTVPSLVGATVLAATGSTGWTAAEKTLAQASGSALVATAPATIAAPTATAFVPRVVAA
jgi:hypothetical protein